MLQNFAVLPPEVNSARVFAGAGSAPMLAAAAAWDGLAGELQSAAVSFGTVTAGVTGGSWLGPASVAMADVAAPYVGWLSMSAAHAEGAAGLARAAAAEFEAAMAATVHPALVATNRAQVVSLVASNLFGQNAPAIAAIESLYEQMWAQDVAALAGYHAGASAVAAQLASWPQQLEALLGSASTAWPVQANTAVAKAAVSNVGVASSVSNGVVMKAAAAQTIALIMGGSGTPIPPSRYVQLANDLYVSHSVPGAIAQALFTPQGLYPVVAVKNLTFDASVAQGVVILDSAIRQQLAAGSNVTVFGYSQSATISSLTMANLAASANPPPPDQLSFTLIGNPNNPNGGVATRFPGISFPSLGVTATGATPDNLYPTRIYTIEYDGVADFPRYPINFVSTLNAIAGAYYVHTDYFMLTPEQIASAVPLTNTVGPTMTQYYVIRTENLPLLEPLRALPVLGNPLADLVQPNLKVIVNLGYGDPAYGYSTSPPNVSTPFGLFPEVSPLTVFDALAAGTQQGISDFAYDISNLDLPSPMDWGSPLTLNPGSTTSGSSPGPAPAPHAVTIDSIIDNLQAANTNVAATITKVAERSYTVLLPTADIANAVLTTAPSYNFNLFLDGIQQAIHGDPMGLVNAVGYPIAADVALVTAAGALELLILINAGQAIAYDISALVP
ncbi:putative PPE family protein PPE42 [Mycobacterium simulans]|uniref:Putative PPE family protein PPE42 n=1 Tax=Mycobacterium simulans TaxID=627089 RepID=A0A7Z7IMP5_9MYCO|nr:PPE family protein [Mycobacterium simulans]SOJ55290.1 putative PPE family protein PPE42 [Mycobacterium simulans]